MNLKHDTNRAAVRWALWAEKMEARLRPAMNVQGQHVAAVMRQKAPTFQSVLVNSIRPRWMDDASGGLALFVGPSAEYAAARDGGTKPGSVPRFDSPAAASLKVWLQRHAPTRRFKDSAVWGKRARSDKVRTAQEAELRDRYEALALYIRARGTKAQPYVKPSAAEVAAGVARSLRLAALGPLAGGAT